MPPTLPVFFYGPNSFWDSSLWDDNDQNAVAFKEDQAKKQMSRIYGLPTCEQQQMKYSSVIQWSCFLA